MVLYLLMLIVFYRFPTNRLFFSSQLPYFVISIISLSDLRGATETLSLGRSSPPITAPLLPLAWLLLSSSQEVTHISGESAFFFVKTHIIVESYFFSGVRPGLAFHLCFFRRQRFESFFFKSPLKNEFSELIYSRKSKH